MAKRNRKLFEGRPPSGQQSLSHLAKRQNTTTDVSDVKAILEGNQEEQMVNSKEETNENVEHREGETDAEAKAKDTAVERLKDRVGEIDAEANVEDTAVDFEGLLASLFGTHECIMSGGVAALFPASDVVSEVSRIAALCFQVL